MNCHFKFKGLKLFFLLAACTSSFLLHAQEVAIKTNLAYWATTTPNLQLELALTDRTTLELGGGINVFSFSDNKTLKYWLIEPEYRWWLCETFNGHFIGLHALGGQFNVGGWDIPIGRLDVFKDSRYEGYLYGGGLSYGYQWILSNRLNFELNVGAGYARIHYDKYPCKDCGTKSDEGNYNYWGVTRLGLSLVYFLK